MSISSGNYPKSHIIHVVKKGDVKLYSALSEGQDATGTSIIIAGAFFGAKMEVIRGIETLTASMRLVGTHAQITTISELSAIFGQETFHTERGWLDAAAFQAGDVINLYANPHDLDVLMETLTTRKTIKLDND
jgi:hypothetical protein